MFYGKAPAVFGGRQAFVRTAASVLAPMSITSSSKDGAQHLSSLRETATSSTPNILLALHRRHRTRARWALTAPNTAYAADSYPHCAGTSAGSSAARGLHTSAATLKKKA